MGDRVIYPSILYIFGRDIVTAAYIYAIIIAEASALQGFVF